MHLKKKKFLLLLLLLLCDVKSRQKNTSRKKKIIRIGYLHMFNAVAVLANLQSRNEQNYAR